MSIQKRIARADAKQREAFQQAQANNFASFHKPKPVVMALSVLLGWERFPILPKDL